MKSINLPTQSVISADFLKGLQEFPGAPSAIGLGVPSGKEGKTGSFFEHLKAGIEEASQGQKMADGMAVRVATGESGNLHETMLAVTKAELAMNLMVQIRNRALEAYQEVMRMQI